MTRGFGARIGRRISAGWLVAVLSLLAACATLPDVKPFTDATVSLRSAVASGGAATVAELGRVESPGVKVEADKLAKAWEERDKLFTALIAYASSLQAIVDSGSAGAESAKALADAVTKLASAANIVQPGAGPAVDVASQTAVFVYEQIAKIRAAASLEAALTEAQPAIERVAQAMSKDMKALDDLVRLASKAQVDAVKIENQARLSYRARLIQSREVLMKRMTNALDQNEKVTQLADAAELKRADELLQAADVWYLPLDTQLKEIADREKVARQLIAESQVALQDWAVAHGQVLSAVRTKRPPSVAELSEAAQRIRDLVQKYRNL